ncbi:MAG: ATP-grasp domain-containing protein [Muribaculaceae bacterium]|nr:ATP-grasp domain-containing protein [Muribaculaceae bacterium]
MSLPSLNIMLLGGGRKVSLSQQFKKSGEKLGFNVSIFSYDLSKEVPIVLEGEVIQGMPWTDPSVVGDICNVVTNKNIDILLPMQNGSIEVASICRVRLPDVFIPVTDFSVAKPLFDKKDAAKLFKELKLPIPKTYSVLSAKMPAIVKPRRGGKSRGIQIFRDMDDLMHLQNLDNYIIQEYIENFKEFTVDAYINMEGEILTTVPRERLEIMGGESTKTITCRNQHLEQFAKDIIRRLRLCGPVNIQFLYDKDTDRYLLLEVNPRLGGAVICSVLAGAPITDYIISEAKALPLIPCDDWKDRTLMATYQKEAVFFNS